MSMRPRTALILLGALLLDGCGSGGAPTTPPPSALRYPGPTILAVGTAASLTPQVSGTVSAWSVSPSLPAGLSISSTSGVISGTPTAVSASASYNVTASNQGGSTSTTVSITVNDVAPSVSYSTASVVFLTNAPNQPVAPTNSGGKVVTWSVNPALPAGLTFSAADGSIAGMPSAVAAPVAYAITAQNSGGESTFKLTIAIASELLDLGHQQTITSVRMTSTRVLSLDSSDLWTLWDYGTATKITGGVAECTPAPCAIQQPPPFPQPFLDIEGPTFVVQTAAGLESRSSVDGTLSAVISTPVAWWRVATDGSYICGGSAGALTVWSPSGVVIASRAGDYSSAAVFAAPGQAQVALGPAGAGVIETVSVPSGTSTVSPVFQGQFNSWFLDGQQFLTNTGNTVWVYSKTAVQQDIRALTTIANLTGQGGWFWNYSSNGNLLSIYKVGASGAPAATYPVGVLTTVAPSAMTIGMLLYGSGQGTVIDLSGSSPVAANFTAPVPYMSAYAATSASQWMVGNDAGVLVDGASLGSTPRFFGYGQAWSIAGSAQRAAVATASGAVLYFNAATLVQEGGISFPATELALSADGSVLAAAGDLRDAQYASTVALNIYSLPAGTETYTWAYTVGSPPYLDDFSLSASGTIVGQVVYTPANITPCARQVTGATGGPVLWSDTVDANPNSLSACGATPIRLSLDGSWVAVSQTYAPTEGTSVMPATNLYQNGALATAVPGWVVGWLDASHILVNNYGPSTSATAKYIDSSVYDTTGTKVTDLPLPAELKSLQVAGAGFIYDPGSNAIYSTTTGLAIWTSATPSAGVGAVAGSSVVFVSGNLVLAEPY